MENVREEGGKARDLLGEGWGEKPTTEKLARVATKVCFTKAYVSRVESVESRSRESQSSE